MNLRAKAGIFEFENTLLRGLKGLKNKMKRKAQEFGYKKGIGFSVILSVAQEKSGKAL